MDKLMPRSTWMCESGVVGDTMQAPFDIAADLDTPVSAYLKLKALKPRFLLEAIPEVRELLAAAQGSQDGLLDTLLRVPPMISRTAGDSVFHNSRLSRSV